MRLLGIDYGSKKIGLAMTDSEGMMAFPHSVIPNDEHTLKTLEKLIEKEGIAEVVIGHSLNKEGNPNKVHEAVDALMLDLTLVVGCPVHLEPEQYTTQEAMRIQGRNEKTDAAAAAIILNSYITRAK